MYDKTLRTVKSLTILFGDFIDIMSDMCTHADAIILDN